MIITSLLCATLTSVWTIPGRWAFTHWMVFWISISSSQPVGRGPAWLVKFLIASTIKPRVFTCWQCSINISNLQKLESATTYAPIKPTANLFCLSKEPSYSYASLPITQDIGFWKGDYRLGGTIEECLQKCVWLRVYELGGSDWDNFWGHFGSQTPLVS